jgi:hypothetical protein
VEPHGEEFDDVMLICEECGDKWTAADLNRRDEPIYDGIEAASGSLRLPREYDNAA